MNGMATGHFMAGIPRREQVFLTDWAIRHVLAYFAIVVIEQERIDAHSTVVTMLKVLPATDSTKAAVVAMIGTLFGRHPQIADITVILSKLYAAIDTAIADERL